MAAGLYFLDKATGAWISSFFAEVTDAWGSSLKPRLIIVAVFT